MTISSAALEAIGASHEDMEREIASLKRQKQAMGERIALLQVEKNEIELRLSLQILRIHEGYLNRITALEDHMNRIANYVQGLPLREEFERVKESVSGPLAREVV